MIVYRKGVSRELFFFPGWILAESGLGLRYGWREMTPIRWEFPLGKLWTWAPGGRQGQRATSQIAGSTQVVVGHDCLDTSRNYGVLFPPSNQWKVDFLYRMGRWLFFLFLQDMVMEFASMILERHAKEPLQKCHPCFPPFHATSMTGSDRLWRSLKTWMFLASSKKQTEGVLQYYCRWWWSLKDFWFSPRKLGKISNLTTAIFFRWVETTN